MPKLPALKAKELAKIAERAGFVLDRTRGSHLVYFRDSDKKIVVVPKHRNKDLGTGITVAIIKQMELTSEEALRLLKKKSLV